MNFNDLDLKNVSEKPGVYFWKDKYGDILYIGKANNLKKRMLQYQKNMHNSYKTADLVKKIESYEVIITNTVKEALVLERNLIEKHSPSFNIRLRDDKRYPYIRIYLTNELNIELAYRLLNAKQDKEIIYGPFPSGYGAKRIHTLLTRMYRFERGLPIRQATYDFWKIKFEELKKLLNSSKKNFIKTLENQMLEASENMQYEIAQELKECIDSLSLFDEKQVVEISDEVNMDAIAFFEKDQHLSITILFYRQGNLLSKKQMIVPIINSPQETIEEFINNYYSKNFIPKMIISNMDFETEIPLQIPIKGEKKEIIDLALKNAEDNIDLKLQEFKNYENITVGALDKLKVILNMEKLSHILMIDNSNYANTNAVSAIISNRNGKMQPKEFRKYTLEVSERKADVDYMKQGVTKYFSKEQNKVPDLFIVDGGVAQVNEVKNIVPTKVIGLVKDDNHSTRAIVDSDGKEISIDDADLMKFLVRLQVEVDRYAKGFHSKRKSLTTFEGKLRSIEGVGKQTEQKLLNHFKTYSAIYNASEDELIKIVSPSVASNIKKFFK